MGLNKFPEKGRVGEVKEISNFLDAHVAVLHLVFDLLDGVFLDELHRCLSCCFLDDGTEIFRAVTKFVGIIGHRAMRSIVGIHQMDEVACDESGSVLLDVFSFFMRYLFV